MTRPRIQMAEVLADPFAALRRAREAGAVADTDIGVAVLRHEAMRDLLGDPRLRANFPDFLHTLGITSGAFHDWMAASPLNKDGAEHQRWRTVVSRTFTPRRVDQIRPFLHDAAHELIDRFASRGGCEFVAEFADVFPSLGLCELIGVPMEDRDRFRGWANTIGFGFSPAVLAQHIAEVDDALTQLIAYTGELAELRRDDPRDDLVTRIAQAAIEDGWTKHEAASAIAGLVFAGHETTRNQLGWMVVAVAQSPDLWDAVAAGTVAATDVVEEVLRFRSAVTGIGRRVTEPVDVDGERLEPGTSLFLSIWSADHDDSVFPRADVLDVQAHRDTPHLAFGHGAHFCLGAALARAELQEALIALTARITRPVIGADTQWKPPIGINGPDRLPLTFTARGR